MKPDRREREMSKKQERLQSASPPTARKKWCGAGVRDEKQQPPWVHRSQRLFGPLGLGCILFNNATSLSAYARHLVKECICRRTTMPINYASAFPGPVFLRPSAIGAASQLGPSDQLRRQSISGAHSAARFLWGMRMARGYLLFFLLAKLAAGLSWRLA